MVAKIKEEVVPTKPTKLQLQILMDYFRHRKVS